ncbi:MAG: MurT ligase domain-containing protein [Candidatus Saccharimonadales bacterium]
MLRLLVIWIGKTVLVLSRLRRGGSALPGLVVERLYPKFIHSLRPHFQTVILVTGTNGKTTTTKMLQEILRCKYNTIVHNQAGSNMSRGIISATLAALDWRGELSAEVGLFEVDEGFAAHLSTALQPEVMVVLNLHRDQLDRYGELERVADLLVEAAAHAKHTVINYDDPRLRNSFQLDSVSGAAAASNVREQVPSDEALYLDDEPTEPDYTAAEVFIEDNANQDAAQAVSFRINQRSYSASLQIPGVFNIYNAALALAVSELLEIDTARAVAALGEVKPAFGRTEEITIGDKTLQILLVKNPSGFNQVIASFLSVEPLPTMIAINDNYADGRDVSWLWDVRIESWAEADTQPIITSGSRGYDMALRLQYADIPSRAMPSLRAALDELLAEVPPGGRGYIVPTYTAMLELRKLIGRRTEIGAWE